MTTNTVSHLSFLQIWWSCGSMGLVTLSALVWFVCIIRTKAIQRVLSFLVPLPFIARGLMCSWPSVFTYDLWHGNCMGRGVIRKSNCQGTETWERYTEVLDQKTMWMWGSLNSRARYTVRTRTTTQEAWKWGTVAAVCLWVPGHCAFCELWCPGVSVITQVSRLSVCPWPHQQHTVLFSVLFPPVLAL